jgi:hypothetical protein
MDNILLILAKEQYYQKDWIKKNLVKFGKKSSKD